MKLTLTLQIAFAVAYTTLYLLWSLAYYRIVDLRVRQSLGKLLNVKIVWRLRKGSLYASPLSFQLRRDTWAWSIEKERRTVLKDSLVYVLCVVVVNVLGGMWLPAILIAVFLGTNLLSALVALPLLFVTIPIYSIFWSGYYEITGFDTGG